MRFINVTDESYEFIKRLSEDRNSTMPETIEKILFEHFKLILNYIKLKEQAKEMSDLLTHIYDVVKDIDEEEDETVNVEEKS